MKETQTKENLIIELAKIRQTQEGWVSGDLQRRREFARAFGWNKPKRQYDSDVELYEPTWVEIFVKLGKLLSVKEFRDFEGNVSELGCRLEKLENKLNNPTQQPVVIK